MTENQGLHFAVQFLAVTFVIFAVHRKNCRGDLFNRVSCVAEVSYPMKAKNLKGMKRMRASGEKTNPSHQHSGLAVQAEQFRFG